MGGEGPSLQEFPFKAASLPELQKEPAFAASQPWMQATFALSVKLGWKVHLPQAGSKDFKSACGGPGTEPGLEQVHRLGAQTYFLPQSSDTLPSGLTGLVPCYLNRLITTPPQGSIPRSPFLLIFIRKPTKLPVIIFIHFDLRCLVHTEQNPPFGRPVFSRCLALLNAWFSPLLS